MVRLPHGQVKAVFGSVFWVPLTAFVLCLSTDFSLPPFVEAAHVSYYCAVGLWKDFSLRILALPSLKENVKQELPVKTLPRSLLFATFDEQAYLLVGLGDGQLLNYKVKLVPYSYYTGYYT